MLEAVVAVAAGAVDAGDQRRADDGLAVGGSAGLLRDEVAHALPLAGGVCRLLGFSAALGPGAGVGAFVGGLAAVVEAEGLLAALAEEGEEIELVAVFELAMLADECRVGALVHFDVARVWSFGC